MEFHASSEIPSYSFSQTCPSEYITQLYGNASQSWAERKRSRASKRDSNRMNPESNGAHNGCYHMDTPATLHTSPSHQCWGTLLWKGRTDLKPDMLTAVVRRNPHQRPLLRRNPRCRTSVRRNPRCRPSLRRNPRCRTSVRRNPRYRPSPLDSVQG